MSANGGNNGTRGGRHLFLTMTERRVRAASPLVREILQNTSPTPKKRQSGNAEELTIVDPAKQTSAAKECPKITSILLADDHPVVREGLSAVINRRPEMRVISEAADGQEALEKFSSLRPDVALIDLRMPLMDGIQAASAICAQDPTARVVIVSTYHDEEDIYRVLQAGARGYILKSAPITELVDCISAVAKGKTWVPPIVGSMLARRVAAPELTKREHEVLHAMAAGKSNKEIGVALDISEGTVKVHMTHILEKLNVSGRTEAIGVAVKKGLVRMDAAAA